MNQGPARPGSDSVLFMKAQPYVLSTTGGNQAQGAQERVVWFSVARRVRGPGWPKACYLQNNHRSFEPLAGRGLWPSNPKGARENPRRREGSWVVLRWTLFNAVRPLEGPSRHLASQAACALSTLICWWRSQVSNRAGQS